MGLLKRAMSLPARRLTSIEKELVNSYHPKMSWKLAKQEAAKTRKILGPGASPDEILRATSERLEMNAPAPEPVEEPVTEEREMETEEEMDPPASEPVKEERELEVVEEKEEEEEEILPGLTCGDIDVTVTELEAVPVAPNLYEKPVEEKLESETGEEEEMDTPPPEPVEKEVLLEMEEVETGIPGLTWGDIHRTNANMQTKLAALMTCW